MDVKLLMRKLLKRRPPRIYRGRYPNLLIDTAYISREKPIGVLNIRVVNKKGVMRTIADIITRENVNIIKATIPEFPLGKDAYIVFVLENCDQKCVDNITNKIKEEAKEMVLDIYSVSSSEGFVFVPYSTLIFIDRRAIVLTEGMLRELIIGLMREEYLTSYVPLILRKIGESIGKQIYEGWVSYIEKYSAEDWFKYVDKALVYLAEFFHALGFAETEILRIGETRYRIALYNNIECESLRERGFVETTGHITAGIIAGYLKALLNREVTVTEIECINKGGEKDVFEAVIGGYLGEE